MTASSPAAEPHLPGRLLKSHYDRTTIAFHWITATLVVLLFGSVVLRDYLPRDLHFGKPLEALHVSFGILFAVVVIGRMVWRLLRGRHLPPAETKIVGLLSQIVHAMLYMLVGLQVVLGFALRWLQGEAFSFFGLFDIPSLLAANKPLSHTFEDLHNFFGWTIVYLAGAHAIAALFHHFVLRDRVLGRMLPAVSS